jgi:hypothetical protein
MDEEIVPSVESNRESPFNIGDRENRWIIGFALLLIGGILLIQNLFRWEIDQWWFILLMIPSMGAFITAWRRYRSFGKSQRSSILRQIVIGVFFLLMTVILFFHLGVQIILPLTLIMVGMIIFVSILLQ